MDFYEILCFSTFRKSVKKFQVSSKYDKRNRYCGWSPMCVCDNMTVSSTWNEKLLALKVQRKPKHIMCAITYVRNACLLWCNVEKCGRARQLTDGNIKRRTRIACWIPKATHPHSEYVIQLSHCNNGCTNAPHCYVRTCIFCVVNFKY